MPFPRFTRGSSGALSFETMNQIFDRIEALESAVSTPGRKDRYKAPPFLARILARNTAGEGWSFEEVTWTAALTPGAFAKVTGGRTSSDGRDQFAFPAVGAIPSVGSIVLLFPMNRDSSTTGGGSSDIRNGSLIFNAIPISAGGGRVARVMSSTSSGTGLWKYSMKDAAVSVSGGNASFTYNNASPSFDAYNGAEAAVDGASYGVGMVPPQFPVPTLNRKAIKTGVVVVCTLDSNGNWVFSIPNGYEVIC